MAFFYYVCLDIMLYSGERGLQIFEAGAVTLVQGGTAALRAGLGDP